MGSQTALHSNGYDHQGETNAICMETMSSVDLEIEDGPEVESVDVEREPGMELGFAIDTVAGELQVSRVLVGSPCYGQLRPGDQLLSVNGQRLTEQGLEQLQSAVAGQTQLNFRVRRGTQPDETTLSSNGVQFLRAPYNYCPSEDNLHPCQKAGLEFKRGDIICVVNDRNPDWWQGCIVKAESEEPSGIARLFPSPDFQKRNQKKSSQLLDYEPQTLLQPNPRRQRPIVLLGPPCGGRHELLVALIQQNPLKFAPPLTHTTRQRRDEETDGADFLFVSEQEFKRLCSSRELLETWKSNGSSYGIAVSSVQKVVDSDRVCVLALRPDSLEEMRRRQPPLRPFSVFLRPDRLQQQGSLGQLGETELQLTEAELASIEHLSQCIEFNIGHLFDLVLELNDLESCVGQIVRCSERLRTKPQWVPTEWMHDRQ